MYDISRFHLLVLFYITVHWLKIAFFFLNHAFLVLQEISGHDLKELKNIAL
jgi:hypothetical protein